MAYTSSFSVNVGDPTKANDVATLAANDDFLKTAIDKIMADSATPTFALANGVTATTQSAGNNSTLLSTTAYADAAGTSLSGSTNNTIATVTGANALIGEANLTFDGSTMNVVGNAGVGIARTDGTLHVHTATAGTVAPSSIADDLIIENSNHVGMSFLKPDASGAYIYFGSPSDNDHSAIFSHYNSGSPYIEVENGTSLVAVQRWGTATSNKASVIGDTDNAKLSIGITINQGANDNEILALKSSDVAHGVTGVTETDTYGLLKKISGAAGGLDVAGFIESASTVGLRLSGTSGEDTSDTSGSNAMVRISANKINGTAQAAVGATGNILAVQNQATTRMILKGNGDMHITNTTLISLDGEDDVSMVRAFQRSASDGLGMVMTEWDKNVTANEEDLRRVGVLSSTSDFVIQQRMNSLLGGSVWQLHVAQKEMQKVYETEIAELKGQLNLLMERN
tara:strand:+ start:411 stop:1772 length:1362 start_codon:yes stop_codon:yes gene_type:complete